MNPLLIGAYFYVGFPDFLRIRCIALIQDHRILGIPPLLVPSPSLDSIFEILSILISNL